MSASFIYSLDTEIKGCLNRNRRHIECLITVASLIILNACGGSSGQTNQISSGETASQSQRIVVQNPNVKIIPTLSPINCIKESESNRSLDDLSFDVNSKNIATFLLNGYKIQLNATDSQAVIKALKVEGKRKCEEENGFLKSLNEEKERLRQSCAGHININAAIAGKKTEPRILPCSAKAIDVINEAIRYEGEIEARAKEVDKVKLKEGLSLGITFVIRARAAGGVCNQKLVGGPAGPTHFDEEFHPGKTGDGNVYCLISN